LGVEEPVLRFDAVASRKLAEMRDAGRFQGSALRVTVEEEGAAFLYQIQVVEEGSRGDADAAVDCDGVAFFVDPASAERLRGAELQYVDSLSGGGFRFENPNRPRLLADPLAARVQRVLDDEINPGVAGHGGRVSLVDVRDGRVFIRFGGGCQGCGMVDTTLREGVVGTLQRAIPEIREVLDATDHAAGETPYY
jgi:Fe/S biogenesis protein NfuA